MTRFNGQFAGQNNPVVRMEPPQDRLRYDPIYAPPPEDEVEVIDLDSGRHAVKPHTWGLR